MTHTLHRTDEELATQITNELVATPALRGAQIFVAVDRGAATLYGRAQHHRQSERPKKSSWRSTAPSLHPPPEFRSSESAGPCRE